MMTTTRRGSQLNKDWLASCIAVSLQVAVTALQHLVQRSEQSCWKYALYRISLYSASHMMTPGSFLIKQLDAAHVISEGTSSC